MVKLRLHVLVLFLSVLCASSCGGGGSSGPTPPPNNAANPPNNPVPSISSVSPTSVSAGSAAFTLTVNGSNFISGSTVQWNGSNRASIYVSASRLTASIAASDVASSGTAEITAVNPSPGGGTSAQVGFVITTPPNPTPALTSISPSVGTVGGAPFTLTVTGAQFIATSQVLWNGGQVPTTYVSSTTLTAQVPASDLNAAGSATVAVQNPAPSGGTSVNLIFTISLPGTNLTVLAVEGSDVAWNPSQKELYVAVPAAASANASTITIVDPIAGSIVSTQQLASAASGLAISDDSQYLYAVTSGGSTIQRFTLPAITPDIQWSMGTNSTTGTANLVGDIKVQPAAPRTLAVSMGEYGSGMVAIFDDAVERPGIAGEGAISIGNSLQWKPDGSELYATYTLGNDSPYYTTSEGTLYVLPVSSTGIGTITSYNSSFRAEGTHLHSDPNTGYVYGDWGEIINSANGIPEGNYRWMRPLGTYFPGPLSVVDPTLQLFYTLLQVSEPDGTAAFQIQSFNQTNFQLLHTIVIPNVIGTPRNFIRWGQAGLAVVTIGGTATPDGQLYILDGNFVNPSGVQDTLLGNPILQVPTLTATSPLTAVVGTAGVNLTLTGSDFIGTSTVYWNATALPTTVVSSTELSVQISASDLTTVAQAAITVSNNGTSSPASNSMPFSVNSAAPAGSQFSVYSTGGADVLWNATVAKLYVSMPGVEGQAGDAIGIVDPVAGSVSSSGFLGSDPGSISLSDDGQYLYVALHGQNAIEQLTLPGFTPKLTWNLGGENTFDGPYYALDLQVAPGESQTTAVTLANFNVSPSSAAVVIYDGSTPRSTPLQSTLYWYSGLKWAGNATTLYSVDQGIPQDFLVLGVGASGAALEQHYDRVFNTYSPGIHYDSGTGLVYTDAGQVINPSNGVIVNTYGASGLAVPDSTLGRVFILGQTSAQSGTSDFTIESFNQTTSAAVGSITIQNVVGTPTSFIRWGTNGLAFTTQIGAPTDFQGTGPGQLYVVSGEFVNTSGSLSPSSATTNDLSAVHRTWGFTTNPTRSRNQFQPRVVHRSPLQM